MKHLELALRKLGARLGATRGRTRLHLSALEQRVRSGEAEIDEKTANILAQLLEGVGNEVQNAKREADQNKRITGRTIAQAMRQGFRG